MAIAKAIFAGPSEIQLTLTPTEAEVLMVVLDAIGGNPDTTPRKHIDAIRIALVDQMSVYSGSSEPWQTERSSLYFREGARINSKITWKAVS